VDGPVDVVWSLQWNFGQLQWPRARLRQAGNERPAGASTGEACRIAALKAGDGPELLVHGSSNLIQTLLRHNLVDRFRLLVYPVVVGSSKRLFGDGATAATLRTEREGFSSRRHYCTYEPVVELRTGSFG
jgi:dihydrofolate reductase